MSRKAQLHETKVRSTLLSSQRDDSISLKLILRYSDRCHCRKGREHCSSQGPLLSGPFSRPMDPPRHGPGYHSGQLCPLDGPYPPTRPVGRCQRPYRYGVPWLVDDTIIPESTLTMEKSCRSIGHDVPYPLQGPLRDAPSASEVSSALETHLDVICTELDPGAATHGRTGMGLFTR